MKQRYTLHDVAKQAGVSYQTVSRVINGHPSVSPPTRARVQQVIHDLGYHPNKVAKSLVANRSQTLAILTFGLDHFGPAQMVIHIERTAKELGYDLVLSNLNELSVYEVRRALDSLTGRQVDGILTISPVTGITYEEIAELSRGIPVVQIDPQIGLNVPSVVVDQKYGSQLATEYLLGLGHRHIAEISGPLNWFGAIARHEQWQATMRMAGLPAYRTVEGDWTARGGYAAARRLLAAHPDLTAIVVGNDQMALGVIAALNDHGLRVPLDVSVVGFDDIPEAAFFRPALTTIQQDFKALGATGVRYLLALIQNPDTEIVQHRLRPHLVIRDSAAPWRASFE
ncbi:MAG: LacI family DNA-binding transcriptional regulator [Aggregatilineales bacterium]